ncbi:metallophosphoesterase [Pseudodesulfovibrio sp.]|uniref:metallophosphoesterase n=1 Tax=Pseudodesulfovibrio sp. TaxID=2035812 RepID=UPI002612B2D6|nr:metallophosphoesterase [Pseudodesulfovibrio sp.]MDD3313519.1 metallophosphoesterase [Pseudodesulfovibrio sp.]
MLRDGKIVFISDIHMCSDEALRKNGSFHPWGWLGEERALRLGRFLSDLADDPRLHTVVVLGDLFDDWVAPSSMEPVEKNDAPDALLHSIAQAEHNQPIKEGFLRLARAGKELRYVRGNHDMFLSDGLLHSYVPDFICEPDASGPGTGAFVIDGLLRAEHGCAYCLANAPYMEDGAYRYPVGYYLARIDAYKRAVTGKQSNYLAIFLNMLGSLKPEVRVGEAVLATAKAARMLGSWFIMNRDYPKSITVREVAAQFMDWFVEWDRRGYPVSSDDAFQAELGRLHSIMYKLWLKPKTVKIVVCGHTHMAKLVTYPTRQQQDREWPSKAIYANSGAWIDEKRFPSCVEVDVTVGKNRADVRCLRVLKSGAFQVVGEGFVHING